MTCNCAQIRALVREWKADQQELRAVHEAVRTELSKMKSSLLLLNEILDGAVATQDAEEFVRDLVEIAKLRDD